MATVRVHAIKGNVQNAINYIIQKNKTKDYLCESNHSNMYCAGIEWKLKAENGKKRKSSVIDDVVGYHFQQSFKQGTVTEDEAFEISKKWIEKITQGKYDYVIATHVDTAHIHTHIIVNPYRTTDNKKLNIFYKRDLNLFKKLSDDICKEHGLEILEPVNVKYERTYYEWLTKNRGDNNKEIIKKTIDHIVPKVKDYDEFKRYMIKMGFTVEDGSEEGNNRQGLRIKVPNSKYFIRCNRILGQNNEPNYSYERIVERISNNGVYISSKEVTDFLQNDYTKKEIRDRRYSFYQDSNVQLSYEEMQYFKMSSYERMLHLKWKQIDKMFNEFHEMGELIYNLDHLDEMKLERKEMQDYLDDVSKQLRLNEKKYENMLEMRMEGILDMSDEQMQRFIDERILPLREQKQKLKREISNRSEIINKTENKVRKHQDKKLEI